MTFWRAQVYFWQAKNSALIMITVFQFSQRVEDQVQKSIAKPPEPRLPIFSIRDSIDFSNHFVIIGDVGTGKSTVTPIHEYELWEGKKQIVLRELQGRPAMPSTIHFRRCIQKSPMNWAVITKEICLLTRIWVMRKRLETATRIEALFLRAKSLEESIWTGLWNVIVK